MPFILGAGVRGEGGTEVTVEVMGERLPNVKPEDEIQVPRPPSPASSDPSPLLLVVTSSLCVL